jgi:nitric oxide reductase NorD protein
MSGKKKHNPATLSAGMPDELAKILGTSSNQQIFDEVLIGRFAALNRDDQQFICHWAEIVSRSNNDLAANFIIRAPELLSTLDQAGAQAWLMDALQALEEGDLEKAQNRLANHIYFIDDYLFHHSRCSLDSVSQFLQLFITGLGGRELTITKHHQAYTDTEAVFLPDHIKVFFDQELNTLLYKLMAVHLWAQTRYGTWRFQVIETLWSATNSAPALDVFNRLECVRLDACIARELPGLYRQFEPAAYRSVQHKNEWQVFESAVQLLKKPGATALDSIALIEQYLGRQLPDLKCYQGKIELSSARRAMLARLAREKSSVQQALGELRGNIREILDGEDEQFSVVEEDDSSPEHGQRLVLLRGDEVVQMTPEIATLMESIRQDFGEIPEHYLEGIMSIPYPSEQEVDPGEHDLEPETNALPVDAASYREWDYLRQRYREGYCLMNEYDVQPVDDDFVEVTLEKYRNLLKSIKKTFEAVLGESKLLRKQSQGDGVDLDALIEAQADFASGLEMRDNLYTCYRNRDRNIAVMFMVDMSGSTSGWINDAERESLTLLCEALEKLGDRYAIYGFSGQTHKRCESYRIKRFDESYSEEVKQRISGIRAKGYTRMGAAIRHLGHLLDVTRARTKILITLSDGRPEDFDAYRGRYAIEDTRHALQELRHEGIHSFCVTIDKEARDYLPHMYGPANYAVIHEVHKLPLKVADIYRRLTAL